MSAATDLRSAGRVRAAPLRRTRFLRLAVPAVVGALSSPARSADAQASPRGARVERAVLAAEDRLNAAWDRGDTVVLRRLIAPGQTWRRTSDSTYTIYNEERAPDGAYVPLDEYACVREGR